MNSADCLSLMRIAATPLVVLCLRRGSPLEATAIFSVAALSDGLDGYLARRRGPTSLGLWLDLVADKVLILTTMAFLASLRVLPAWMALLVGGRELAVATLRLVLRRRGVLLPADRWGKAKMATLCVAIGGLLLARARPVPFLLHHPAYGLLLLGVALTLLSGANYGLKACRLLWGRR